ncbi:hypothetical protein N321_07536, partial [Antrostomus carolinensis]
NPQATTAVYPHFIREQRTKDNILRKKLQCTEDTPGPGTYNVDRGYRACLPHSPSIIIQGIRRPKRHDTGPFTTL